MLLYNITMQVEWRIHDVWLLWMYETYLPFAMASGCFEKYQLVKLLEVENAVGITYALQLYASNKVNYNCYLQQYQPKIEQQSLEKWEDSLLSFATLMEVIKQESAIK